jgi:putative ABC transport system substrate-binding protein
MPAHSGETDPHSFRSQGQDVTHSGHATINFAVMHKALSHVV